MLIKKFPGPKGEAYQRSSMGATLASFGKRDAAEQFIAKSGGKLARFDEITLEVITALELGTQKH